jgi:hypothetical protein
MPRAARSMQKPASTGPSDITITVPTQSNRPPDANPSQPALPFWEAVHATTPEQWREERVVYVYRDNPVTPGMKGNIHTFREDFDEDVLREMFGGYEYRLMLVRRKTGTMLATITVHIAAPPKAAGKVDPAMLNYGTVGSTAPTVMPPGMGVTDVLNQFVGVMRDQMERSNPGDKNTTELLMTASKKAIEIVTQQQASNPLEMFRLMMELQKQNQGPENSMMQVMMAKIVERAFAPPESNLLGQLSAFEKIAELIGIRGGGGGKQDLGAMLIAKLPDIAQGASVLMAKYVDGQREKRLAAEANARGIAYARGTGAPLAIADPNPPVNVPAAPSNVREFQQPAAAPTYAPLDRDPVNAQPDPAELREEEGAPSFDWLRRRVAQMVMMGSGSDTVVDFISGADPRLMAILRSAQIEELRDFFTKDPILVQCTSYAGFEAFLKDAYEYLHEDNVPEPVN